jgi:tetratricopeptide (TPR) repeat protein
VSWERATTAGLKAFEQGNYTEAAQQFQSALAIVETIKPDDPRLANSLMRLAVVYHTQGRYAEAEPLYQRALMLQEQMFGPDQPQLLEMLEAYANLQRRMHPFQSLLPWSTANKLAARARRIREREERSSAQDPTGAWSDYAESAIFRGGEP